MFARIFELPVEATKAYLRWTFATTADNLLWGIWLGAGAVMPLVNWLVWLPVVGGMIPDIIAIRVLTGLATAWWWYGLGLMVVVYGAIWLTPRRY